MYYTLKDFCEELSISTATGRNWMKLGKITPEYTENRIPYFSKEYASEIKKSIQSGTNTALKSRRNKKYVSGTMLYQSYVSEHCKSVIAVQQLMQSIAEEQMVLNDEQLQLLIADCAAKLFVQKYSTEHVSSGRILLDFLENRLDFGEANHLFRDLISDTDDAVTWIQKNPKLFQTRYEYEENEDILGLLYLSCKNIKKRKITGSYYTPTWVVKQLIQKLTEKNGTDGYILDPCCGTGNFLLQLPEEFPLEKIYGNDLDAISVKITRLNLALKFQNADIDVIYNNITNQNYLSEYEGIRFDLIIGNPPWGYSFGVEEADYLRKQFFSASGNSIESYDVFLEKALSQLNKNGVLSFVLPEAILTVKSHLPIRKLIAKQTSIQYIEFLGDVFDNVQCPCIILQLQHAGEMFCCPCTEIRDGNRTFQIDKERDIQPECFSFRTTNEEYQIFKKVSEFPNAVYLKDNAVFALGIVTGNNKVHISKKKTSDNERILKGSDLLQYRIKDTDNYIVFQPENFQQTAPVEYYRAPEKLLYRFISNRLVFAYDDKQTLSLNSCNILIPEIPGIQMKYVLAILNSRVAQFLYKKQFQSVKVLKSHLEQIPIPMVSSEQQAEIINYVERLLVEMPEDETNMVYEELDDTLRKLYLLTDAEYQILKNTVDGVL